MSFSMRSFLFRLENLLLFGYVLFFWAFDIYLLYQGIDLSVYGDFYTLHMKVFFILLALPVMPYFFYYRLWKNDVKSSRIYNFYFPFSFLLITIVALLARLELLPFYLSVKDYNKAIGGFYRPSPSTLFLFYGLISAYIVLQIIFIIDSFRMVRKHGPDRTKMINNIGKE